MMLVATVPVHIPVHGAWALFHLGLDRPREQRMRALTQNVGERIGKGPWLGKLENVSLGHGVSLLVWER
jgi:hypothetical protein